MGYFLAILLWATLVVGSLIGMMWLRWQVDKRHTDSYWRRQPP